MLCRLRLQSRRWQRSAIHPTPATRGASLSVTGTRRLPPIVDSTTRVKQQSPGGVVVAVAQSAVAQASGRRGRPSRKRVRPNEEPRLSGGEASGQPRHVTSSDLTRYRTVEPPRTRAPSLRSSPLGRTLRGLRFDWEGWFRNGTNLGINGLVSADRNNKATLLLTTPRCTIKSSAKDLSLRIVKLQYTSYTSGFFHPLMRC